MSSDLPPPERGALTATAHGVEPVAASADIWQRYAVATPWMTAEAERRMTALQKLEELLAAGMGAGEARDLVAAEHGETSRTLLNWRNLVRGQPRTEWLPHLAPRHARKGRKAEIDDEMWRLFLGFIKESGPTMALRHAWRETKRLAESRGAAWPSYDSVLARWNALPAQERALLRHGTKARDALIPHQTRSVAHLRAMQIVNLDGRYADVFVEWEDGTISRPIVLTAQDVFSRKIVGRAYVKTENSDAIKELILLVGERLGVPAKILCDNGRGFNAKKLTGGTCKGFRCRVDDGTRGLFVKAGIELIIAGPYNGRAKPIERHYREDAREIDARPEFKGAHCGGRPDAKPEDFTGKAVPIATFVAVYEACTAEQNARTCRRTEMCGGVKSFDQVFDESVPDHPLSVWTMKQRLYLSRDERLVTPDQRDGAIRLLGHRYWSAEARDALKRHCGKKVRVLYDPKNLAAGVRVENLQGHVIAAELPRLAAGRFDSTDDARNHARGVQMDKRAVKLQERATRAQVLAEFGVKKSDSAGPGPTAAPVIRPNFSPAARPAKSAEEAVEAPISAEVTRLFHEGLDRHVEKLKEDQGLCDWGSLEERGGAATPPAQSATQAEACPSRTKTA